MRFISLPAARWSQASGRRGRPRSGVLATPGPVPLQRVDVDLHVVGRRVARREVLGLDEGAARRAVELEDATPRRIGGEGELVTPGVQQGPVDLPRVAVVDKGAPLVVVPGRAQVVVARPAHPAFGVQVDLKVLGHRNSHQDAPSSSARDRSPAGVRLTRQPPGTGMVKNGPSITSGPVTCSPGAMVSRGRTRNEHSAADESRISRVVAAADPSEMGVSNRTCSSGAVTRSVRYAGPAVGSTVGRRPRGRGSP